MQQLLAIFLALSGMGGAAPSGSMQDPVDGLVQASQQAPRVALDQLIPVNRPPVNTIKRKPAPALPSKPSRCQNFKATVYGPPWGGIEGPGMTATGIKPVPGKYLIAVDPSVIPLGSKVSVQPNPHGWGGAFLAADTGGGIKGHHIDIFMWQGPKAMDVWGVRLVRVCKN